MINGFKDGPFYHIVCPIPGWQNTTVAHHVYSHTHPIYIHENTCCIYAQEYLYDYSHIKHVTHTYTCIWTKCSELLR